ncbi:ribonuclease HI [Halapricum sp. CBA1109]|uniref:ribonuclease HI n=1 Tax=Halapricum sp. CBA1109 TaxID=2668068 RepID=UPI00272DF9A0|nr:ribonuclease HI [Halapricum sp. CBA1109]
MPVIECDVSAARERLEDAGVDVESGNTDHERCARATPARRPSPTTGKSSCRATGPSDWRGLLSESGGRAHVYFDGASRGNPGPAAIGWVVVTGDGGIVSEGNDRIGTATNNRAEYEALIRALEVATDHGFDSVEVRGDSELIVKQVRGEYDANDPDLRERRVRVRELLSRFGEWSLDHVPREINERADELANEAFEDD